MPLPREDQLKIIMGEQPWKGKGYLWGAGGRRFKSSRPDQPFLFRPQPQLSGATVSKTPALKIYAA